MGESKGRRLLSWLTVFMLIIAWSCRAGLWSEEVYAAGTDTQAFVNQSSLSVKPGVSALGYCVLNSDTGEVVLASGENMQFHPASITKVMTLLVTAENCDDLDQVITVSENAINQIAPLSSTLDPMPKPGEQFTVRDMLYGLIMRSGNECANILAEAVSGDIDSFVDLMNERAEAAGALNTHFSNPHGLDEDDHLTTAYDMAMITKAALENPVAKEILSAQSYTIPATEYAGERAMTSGHSMVNGTYSCDGVYAGKPGFTRLAQSTLVTAAVRNGVNLIAVVMKCDSGVSYTDTELLLDDAYALLNNQGLRGGFNAYHPQVSDADSTGFTVTWEVGSDAVRVMFPVWIEYDSTDTITMDTAEVTGSTISYRVSLSDHGNKAGVYTVQAYVYNELGQEKISTVKVLGGIEGLGYGFVTWNGAVYYIHENGALGLQWQELEEGCFYFDYITAQMQTGWLDFGTRFYMDRDGKMHTGWLLLDGKQYYFFAAGDMVIGRMRINGEEYYFGEDGALQEGFVQPQLPTTHE